MQKCIDEKDVNSEKVSRKMRKPRAKLKEEINEYWDTEYSMDKIAALLGCRWRTVKEIFVELYGEEAVEHRSKACYSRSSKKISLHMKTKTRENHPNWKGHSKDHKGYYTVIKPDWWTTNQKRVFEHHVIAGIKYGFTEMPKGFVVHHVDGNGYNNHPDNLLLMTIKAHNYYHRTLLRMCNDYPKGVGSSDSKSIPSENEDDIV